MNNHMKHIILNNNISCQLTKNELINFLQTNKEYFKDKYGIHTIGLFGSYAKNKYTSTSDIDLIIIMEKDKKNLHNYLAFKNELEHILKRKVDIGFEHTIKKSIKDEILKDIIYV